jgi:hypothetical protein
MKRHHLVLAAVLVAIIVFVLAGRRTSTPPQTPPEPIATPSPATPSAQPLSTVAPGKASATPRPASTPIAALPPSPSATPKLIPRPAFDPYNPPQLEGSSDVEKTKQMLKDYRTTFGENPFGTNAEIMKSIMGGNKKGAMLGPPEGMSLNGFGELVDHWDNPIFFHQLSREVMEVRSAGPDGRMWTGDDVILK